MFTSVPRQAISTGLWTELRFLPKPVISRAHVPITRKGLSVGKRVGKAREVAMVSRQRSRKHLSLKPAPGAVIQWVWAANGAVLHITHHVIHVMEKYAVSECVNLKNRFEFHCQVEENLERITVGAVKI